jgi:hypothetical protein
VGIGTGQGGTIRCRRRFNGRGEKTGREKADEDYGFGIHDIRGGYTINLRFTKYDLRVL